MKATPFKIDGKKYRIIPESDFLILMQDIKDLGKVLGRHSESGKEARAFFKAAENKSIVN